MRSTRLSLAVAAALALGVAACGSDNSNNGVPQTSNSGGDSGKSTQLGGTLNGAGATFPQPVYQEWAARFQEKSGTTVNFEIADAGA